MTVSLSENERLVIRTAIEGALRVAYGSGLQGIEDFDANKWTDLTFDLIDDMYYNASTRETGGT